MLDLMMGYYDINLTGNTSILCEIIILGVKYHYKCLPMWVDNLPEVFQQKMNYLSQRFELIRAFINEILIPTKGD